MKYSILGFSQQAVIALRKEVGTDGDKVILRLDMDDLLILNLLAEMFARPSIKKILINDRTYCWISYDAILSDLPILDISKRRLSQRLMKMQELGLIEKIVEKEKGFGTFTYIRLTEGYESLKYRKFDDHGTEDTGNNFTTVGKKFPTGRNKCATKDIYTIQDNNTKEKEYNISDEILHSKESADSSITDNEIPSDYGYDSPKRKVAPKEKVEPWRTDFDEYMKLVEDGAAALKADDKFRAEKERLMPNVNYEGTIDNCVTSYWGTEQAWEHKRRSRTKKIDMKATLRQNFDKNRIYKDRNDRPQMKITRSKDIDY